MSQTASRKAADLLTFLEKSPSPFHAVSALRAQLLAAGYAELKEKDRWQLAPSGKYFVTRNGSALLAFALGGKWTAESAGFAIVGAHTDSPCLKIKPVSKREKSGWTQLGVQTYGGGLWHTWFDRDLAVAGRAVVESNGKIESRLVRISSPILRIPNLAIHLDRTVSEAFKFNTETHLAPVMGVVGKKDSSNGDKGKEAEKGKEPVIEKHDAAFLGMLAKEMGCDGGLLTDWSSELAINRLDMFTDSASQILDLELCLYDTQPPAFSGLSSEFIVSARLDNLFMSWCAAQAFIGANKPESLAGDNLCRMLALFDNEEVGSTSAYGADSHYMEATLRRILTSSQLPATTFEESLPRSFLISADMAHALHPNYPEKHEENHKPVMGGGLVIKTNANQRYASTAVTSMIVRELAKMAGVKVQEFVVRNDSPCGSTIGPLLSAKLGIRTVDVGAPQLSMHSIREQAGTADVENSIALLEEFYAGFGPLDARIVVD